jgi:hypothetical protein
MLQSTYPNVCLIDGKGADAKHNILTFYKLNGTFPRVCLLDIPRVNSDFVSYQTLEQVKNMFFHSGKFEGGTVNGPEPHVLVFSNARPDLSKMSNDRWKIGEIKDNKIVW